MKSVSDRSVARSVFSRALTGGIACVLTLGLMSCSEGASERKVASAPAVTPADYHGTVAHVRRITPEQYQNTVHYIFGRDLEVGNPFAPLRRTDGLVAAGAASAGVTTGELQQLQRSASSIAAQVVDKGNIEQKTPSRRDFLVPCKPADPAVADDACAAKFISQTSRLLYRRPLPDARVTELVATAHKGTTDLKDFYAGLGTVLEGMLIDPKVLLIADVVEPDPAHPGKQRLDAYSLASRLSFFLWNAAPDDALLKAAEKGDLFDAKKRAKIVEMMIASPRLEDGVRAFFDDMFGFEDFANLAKDPTAYPMMTGAVIKDAREQTLRTIVEHLLVEKKDYRDLYTTRSTFMSPALATVYQVPTKPGWVPYEFPKDSPRVGLLTQISFLALGAHPARSSPTYRGKALREKMLCQKVPAPPANVDFSALENPAASHRTQRDRVDFHLQNPVCAGCHKITDPMGLVLENFDGAGRFRTTEKGAVIDVTGTLDGKNVDGPAQLGQAMHDHPALTSCLVRRLYSYGTGGPLTRGDNPAIEALNKAFGETGYRVPDLLRMIANSDAFYEVIATPVEQKSADAGAAQSAAAH
ncbi:MAG: DUF1592 domain-containing protein [Rhodospirillaceae bacterium]|nr:DUF1592 domain-containing protein [Rhodospirillaceae bacterium]